MTYYFLTSAHASFFCKSHPLTQHTLTCSAYVYWLFLLLKDFSRSNALSMPILLGLPEAPKTNETKLPHDNFMKQKVTVGSKDNILRTMELVASMRQETEISQEY